MYGTRFFLMKQTPPGTTEGGSWASSNWYNCQGMAMWPSPHSLLVVYEKNICGNKWWQCDIRHILSWLLYGCGDSASCSRSLVIQHQDYNYERVMNKPFFAISDATSSSPRKQTPTCNLDCRRRTSLATGMAMWPSPHSLLVAVWMARLILVVSMPRHSAPRF